MRLLLAASSVARGGAEEYMRMIAVGAHRRGHDVHVALADAAALDELAAQIAHAGVRVHRAPIGMGPDRVRLPRRTRAVTGLIRRIRPDAVHLTLPWPDEGLAVMLACALRRTPLVCVFQLVADPPAPGRLLPLYRWCLRRRQRWVAVSHANRVLLARGFQVPESAIDMVHNGTDAVSAEVDSIRAELGLGEDTPLIVTVGRLDPQKGHDRILAAAADLTRRFAGAHFVWAGAGPERERLMLDVDRRGLADRVHFLGSRTDVGRIVASATVFLFPSRFEGLPFAVIEAMHAGTAIVASSAGGIPELIRNEVDGLIVDAADAAALSGAIGRLLSDSGLRARLGSAARQRAREFGADRMIRRTLGRIAQLAGAAATAAESDADPTVSVVIPTRNRAALLRRAIESVRAQTQQPHEIIIVDDASSDRTATMLGALAAEDPRVRVLRNREPLGAARARNIGIAAAGGSLIAFLDDDDEWLPRKLERQRAALLAVDAGLAYCPYLHVDEQGRQHVRGAVDATGADVAALLARGNFIATPGVLVRTELLRDEGGFDERMPMLEDWELWLRLSERTRLAYVPEPLLRVHQSAGSLSSRADSRLEACNQLLKRFEGIAPGNRRLLGNARYALGVELMLGGVPAAGRAFLRRAMWLHPWPPRRMLMTVAAHLGAVPYGKVAALHRWLREDWRPAAALPASIQDQTAGRGP